MNVPQHIDYWRTGSEEDLAFAKDTIQRGKVRYGLFFAHLALEKIIKALVCKATAEVPPKSHSLVRLAELARIELNVEKTEFLDEMTGWCLSGRYPEFLPDEPTEVQAENLMLETIKCHIWLTSQL